VTALPRIPVVLTVNPDNYERVIRIARRHNYETVGDWLTDVVDKIATSPAQHDEVAHLTMLGFTDREIAGKLNITVNLVGMRRRRAQLPPNKPIRK
jgi:hypothetical protein